MQPQSRTTNETIRLCDNDQTAVLVSRAGDEGWIVQHVNKANGDLLVQLEQRGQGAPALTFMDYVYWSCRIDGRPATSADLSDLLEKKPQTIHIDADTRTIDIAL